MSEDRRQNFILPLHWYFLTATGLAVLLGFEWWLSYKQTPQPFLKLFGISLTTNFVWAIIGLVIWRAVQRFPLAKPTIIRDSFVHFLFACLAVAIQMGRYELVTWYFAPDFSPHYAVWIVRYFLRNEAISYGVIYFSLVFVVRGILADREARDSRLRSARLAEELASAELRNLKAQIQPHFLFNTLNAISGLMRTDLDAADLLIEHLGDLLHTSLELGKNDMVFLRDELHLAEQYLQIQKIRFSRTLSFTIDADPAVLESRVPSLLLQPLVENAVVHGVAASTQPGQVRLNAQANGDRLCVWIFNTVPDRASDRGSGLGLANTLERLRLLFGDKAELKVQKSNGGFTATILLPLTVVESLEVQP